MPISAIEQAAGERRHRLDRRSCSGPITPVRFVQMQKVTDESVPLPRVPSADDVLVMVGGGPGKHSAVVPNCTFSRAVSRVVDRAG